jgi:hypothetical protein
MDSNRRADACMYVTLLVLCLILVVSAAGTIILAMMNQPSSDLLIGLGVVSGTALVRLLLPTLLI